MGKVRLTHKDNMPRRATSAVTTVRWLWPRNGRERLNPPPLPLSSESQGTDDAVGHTGRFDSTMASGKRKDGDRSSMRVAHLLPRAACFARFANCFEWLVTHASKRPSRRLALPPVDVSLRTFQWPGRWRLYEGTVIHGRERGPRRQLRPRGKHAECSQLATAGNGRPERQRSGRIAMDICRKRWARLGPGSGDGWAYGDAGVRPERHAGARSGAASRDGLHAAPPRRSGHPQPL